MLQVAIIGMGTFGIRLLEEISSIDADIIIIDKDRNIIEKYKEKAKDAYIADAINEQALRKMIPPEIDAVIIDFGESLESSIMTVNYLHRMGIKKIIVEAQTDEQGEVLRLVGASQVIFPEREAAKRITPLLASSILFNFMQISPDFALAEIAVNDSIEGKTLIDSNMRQKFQLNIVAYRKTADADFQFINDPKLVLQKEFILLVAGTNTAINKFLSAANEEERDIKTSLFNKLFPKRGQKNNI